MKDMKVDKQIDDILAVYEGWRAELVSQIRTAIKAADQAVIEEVKWKMPTRPTGWPVWSHDGMLCLVEVWKNDVKLIFFKGAQLADLQTLFNARLNSKNDRAIEYHEGDAIDTDVIQKLIQAAIRVNQRPKN